MIGVAHDVGGAAAERWSMVAMPMLAPIRMLWPLIE